MGWITTLNRAAIQIKDAAHARLHERVTAAERRAERGENQRDAWQRRADELARKRAAALVALRQIGARHAVSITSGDKSEYDALREAMKSSREAAQAEYQRARVAFAALQERQKRKRRRDRERDTVRDQRHAGVSGQRCPRGYLSAETATALALGLQWSYDRVARQRLYRDDRGEVCTVERHRVEQLRHDEGAEIAALRLAAARFGGAVSLTGSADHRQRQTRRCPQLGIAVTDRDLAHVAVGERQRTANRASRAPEAHHCAGPKHVGTAARRDPARVIDHGR